MEGKLFLVILFTACFTGVFAGEWCTDYSDSIWDSDHTKWCDSGCCGHYGDEYCCLDSKTGMIVGIVIGSIALVALIVSVPVAVFCCCRKSRGRQGQVFQPTAQTTTAVNMQGMQTTTVGYGQVGYNGVVSYPVVTSHMAPATVQQWQQPPPSYDQTGQKNPSQPY